MNIFTFLLAIWGFVCFVILFKLVILNEEMTIFKASICGSYVGILAGIGVGLLI